MVAGRRRHAPSGLRELGPAVGGGLPVDQNRTLSPEGLCPLPRPWAPGILRLGSVSQGSVVALCCPATVPQSRVWHGGDWWTPSWSRSASQRGGLFLTSWVPGCDDLRSGAKDAFNVLFAFKNTASVCTNTWQEAAPPHQWFPGDG